MFVFHDQLKRPLTFDDYPQRIVSLVPSQTELLVDLGLKDKLVGVTKFCVHPPTIRGEKTLIGGTKRLHLEKIRALKPDLIIGNKEENDREQILELSASLPVWISDVSDLPSALEMIERLGALTNTQQKATKLNTHIKAAFGQLLKETSGKRSKKVVYFIWKDPWMVAGQHTFIHDMLVQCGWQNICISEIDEQETLEHSNPSRYPTFELDELASRSPELVLLSSEPFPFKEKHLETMRKSFPNAKVKLVDGEFFSWYGSRLLKAPEYFSELRKDLEV